MGAERFYCDRQKSSEFRATVTDIREASRTDGRSVWQIALDRTAMSPADGGEPCDTGVLVATARSGASIEIPVTSVVEDDSGEIWHATAKPLLAGTEVIGRVNPAWRRSS